MSVTEDRKFDKNIVFQLLENAIGKTLGEIDSNGSKQFDRTESNSKITGIAGDVVEQSLFGFARDSKQECDIEIDGQLIELKTTGVRIPKKDANKVIGKGFEEYSKLYNAKEGISITRVTFTPYIELDFENSHFWEKSERLLIVFYEYKSYSVVPASQYYDFPVVGYCYNKFSDNEKAQLKNDWEIVRDYLQNIYEAYDNQDERDKNLIGFTHKLRPSLLLIELVPGFKRKSTGSYQRPRYRLKKTFIDYIVQGHFANSREEVSLKDSFSSLAELDAKCHTLTQKFKGKTLPELKELLDVTTSIVTKDFVAKCIIKMFDAECKRLNQILDFTKVGIIAKTITITPTGGRTEDMKLASVDFEEWSDRDIDFEESELYSYFNEHSFLCPIFMEMDENDPSKTIFEGFKRFSFDDEFINSEVRRTWENTRYLIHQNKLEWVYVINKKTGERIKNKSGSYKGAPNLPKSAEYTVFLRGGADVSTEESRSEIVNNIKMLPQFFWLKGSFITEKLRTLSYL